MKRFILILLLAIPSVALLAQQQTTSFTIDTISDAIFARMWKKSYKADCTIPRSDLRYLRVLHVDAQGKTHEGEIVCNKKIAKDLIEIFRQLYKEQYPIERIRLVDEYDADDELSMRDNNSSCFNFRTVPGSKKLSKHAQGLAIDINTLYNPYVRRNKQGKLEVMPANAQPYVNRSRSFTYKIKQGDLLHRLFIQHGFRWGGAWRYSKDYQHFEK
ncbi:MAG: M15 family metallopeptidase [Prevotella sp.]|nr:M15 family metallopeptidase [Prevotella sp.]